MNRIITISREFGSGGRELGKRLAGALGIPCYDHEIIEMIAKENGFNEDYVAHVAEKSIEAAYPLTIGHRFGMQPFQVMDQPIRVAVAQRQIVENFAKQGDCVIVGRAADVILQDYKPLNIFVYADKESKIERCQRRAPEAATLRLLLRSGTVTLRFSEVLSVYRTTTPFLGISCPSAGIWLTTVLPSPTVLMLKPLSASRALATDSPVTDGVSSPRSASSLAVYCGSTLR